LAELWVLGDVGGPGGNVEGERHGLKCLRGSTSVDQFFRHYGIDTATVSKILARIAPPPALLDVDAARYGVDPCAPRFDRVGEPDGLKRGDAVYPAGNLDNVHRLACHTRQGC
jgi:hypothetical protein